MDNIFKGRKSKHFDPHEPSCQLKSENVENVFSEANYSSDPDNQDKERKTNNIRGCVIRKHLQDPSFKSKFTKFENQSESEDSDLDFKVVEFDAIRSRCIEFNEFCRSVQLKRDEISCAKSIINPLMGEFLKELKSLFPLKWQMLNSRSYYSKVMVSEPNEFEYMLYSEIVQCRIEPYAEDLCFCRVFVTNKDDLPYHFGQILTAENELKPSKFKKFTFEVFEYLAIKNRHLTIINTNKTCPAFTVKYKNDGHKETGIDLVPCLVVTNVPEIYTEWDSGMICKQDKDEGNLFVVPEIKIVDGEEVEVWRLSYSFFEKEMIRRKCTPDERTIIRILKKIREEIKDENSALCSYHIVTSCLHFFHKTQEPPRLKEYTINVMDSLIRQLRERKLPHFFVKASNILADVEESECQMFIQSMNYYKDIWTYTPFI